MAYHDGHSNSKGAKSALLLFTFTGLLFSIIQILKNQQSELFQKYLLLACAMVFYFRLVICLLVFVKRKVSWFEGCVVGVLYGALVYFFSLWGSMTPVKINVVSYIGTGLFIAGSWINSQSDYQRYKWKKKTGNEGHLYTGGLFRYAIHINFLGDNVMFLGYALITQNGLSFIPVTAILLNFILFQIPGLDDYLLKRYGDEFKRYAQVTKKFIPFIY